MLDATWLADLGRASVEAVWLPVLVWTAVAAVLEGALRVARPAAALSLPVRGTLLASLPLAVAVPALLRMAAPETAQAVAAVVPSVVWLPEVAVGGPAPVVEAAGPPALEAGLGVLAVVVAAASLWALAVLGRRVWQARQTQSALDDGSESGRRAVEDARRRLEVARPVVAARAPDGAAPFTVGWRRPVVALPDGLGPDALGVAALHEVAHVRRSDYAWHAAQRAVSAAFAAHPLVWALGRGLDLDRERAADAAVLEAGGDRRSYAGLLFSYATLPAPALALGAGRGSSSLKRRIDAMTRPLSPVRSRRLSTLGRLAGLVAVSLVVAGAALVSPPPPAGGGATASDDPTSYWIETIDVVRTDGPFEVVLQLKSGADLEVAEAVAASVEETAFPDAMSSKVTIRYDDGEIRRDMVVVADIVAGTRAEWSMDPGYSERFGVAPRGEVTSIETTLARGLETLQVFVDGTVSVREAREIADAFAASSRVRSVTVVLEDGRTVQRRGRGATTGARRDTTEVLEVAQVQPELVGGLEGLADRLVYPKLQARAGVEGTAVVQFVVGTDGRVTDAAVIRSAGNDGLDRAALEAARGSRFTPGMEDGRPVRVRFALPVTFRLGDAPPPREPRPGVVSADDPEIYEVAEVQPELIGGLAALQERVVYPRLAREAGIEGQVVVQFVVNERGRVQDAVVLRSPDDLLSRASLEAVEGLEFRPGREGGVPVKTRFAVPVTFRLPGGDGVDRGEAGPGDAEQRRRLPHSGTDLTLLENEDLVRHMLRHALGALDERDADGGTVTVRYTLLPNGSTTDVEVVENTSGRVLGGLAAGLAATMTFEEDRRPPQPYPGATFRLDYRRP